MDINHLYGLLISVLLTLAGVGLKALKERIEDSFRRQETQLERLQASLNRTEIKVDTVSDDLRLLRTRLHETGTLPWAM